jgi:hypothetical protein
VTQLTISTLIIMNQMPTMANVMANTNEGQANAV